MMFKSINGIKYWFDDTLGISFPLNSELEKTMCNEQSNEENYSSIDEDTNSEFNTQFIKKINRIKQFALRLPQQIITPQEMKHQILRYGLLQLTLGITEKCNLKCRYCYFSEVYSHSRNPSSKMMDFQTQYFTNF